MPKLESTAKPSSATLVGTRGPNPEPTYARDPLVDRLMPLGNQAVQRLLRARVVQAKLPVSQPNDPEEIGADRIADEVMDHTVLRTSLSAPRSSVLARKCAKCEGEDVEGPIQRSANEAPSSISAAVVSSFPGGRPWPSSLRHVTEAGQRLLRNRIIQAKLTVNNPGDVFEQQADRVAEQVIRMPQPVASQNAVAPTWQGLRIRQMCPKCEEGLHRQPVPPAACRQTRAPQIQRACSECQDELQTKPPEEEEEWEKILQTKELPGRAPEVTPGVESQINAAMDGGQPLPESARAFFEPRFGHDFSQVRIHADSKAAETARAVNARAFTSGNHVFFNAGQLTSQTTEGRLLLAHELVHTLQQSPSDTGESNWQLRRDPDDGEPEIPVTPDQRIVEISRADLEPLDQEQIATLMTATLLRIEEADPKSDNAKTLRKNLAVLRESLATECGAPAAAGIAGAHEGALLVRFAGEKMYVIRVSDVRRMEKTGDWPQSAAPEPTVPASLPEASTCEALDEGVTDTMFAAVGAGAGETVIVSPGDGLYMPALVRLMELDGVDLDTARSFVLSAIDPEQLGEGEQEAETAEAGAAPAAAAGATGAATPKKRPEPTQLAEGKMCHSAVGGAYAAANPPTIPDESLISIIQMIGLLSALAGRGTPTPAQAACYMLRPDLYDVLKQQVYEIKSLREVPRAVGEALLYAGCFSALQLQGLNVQLGDPGNPGTSGWAIAGSGWCIYTCPVPGALIYEYILRPENPRAALERLEGAIQGRPELGINAVMALGLGIAGVGVGLAELGAAVTFEQLLLALVRLAPALSGAGTQVPAVAH